jgi:hypothetical protein
MTEVLALSVSPEQDSNSVLNLSQVTWRHEITNDILIDQHACSKDCSKKKMKTAELLSHTVSPI